ncbi:MAG: glycosyl amidation-associated protein WbuZ [FCB group bacterium]|nr:glycosyl amidation-associated protein WbuZ [FCB group bacterium]
MLKTRVMPCLLLEEGRLVKTVKFKKPTYVGDPINAVKIYNEKEVDELILLDILATKENRKPPFDLIEEVAGECFMPLTYGGGIRSIEDIKRIHNLGAEKVAINSRAAETPELVRQAADLFGSQSIVVSIDVKKTLLGKYKVYSNGGSRSTGIDPVTYSRQMEDMGAGEILLNAIDCDGSMNGYDVNLINMVAAAVNIPLIALGGAGGIDDLVEAVTQGGASAVAAGSLFVYQGGNRAVLINFPIRRELETRLA